MKKHFGEPAGRSPEEVRQQIDKLTATIGTASGNPYQGKKLFGESCGKCHILFEQGGKIGPDLTSYKRDDLRGILLNVVNPSAEIREGFENYLVRTLDGRVEDAQVTEDEADVRKWMTSLDRLPLFRTARLEANREYYLQVSVRARPHNGPFLGLSSPSGFAKFTFIR